MNVLICLPAYNEKEAIARQIALLRHVMREDGQGYSIVVVDDGSDDGTAGILQECSGPDLQVLRHEVNQGLGRAIDTGLRYCAKAGAEDDIVVTMDSDTTHPVGLIFQFVRRIREGADVVVASRFVYGGQEVGVPIRRRLYSRLGSYIPRVLFPHLLSRSPLSDFTCGFRAYRVPVLRSVIQLYGDEFVTEDGFSCMLEILLKLRRMGSVFSEVPLILRYDLKPSETKMKALRNIRRSLFLLIRQRLPASWRR